MMCFGTEVEMGISFLVGHLVARYYLQRPPLRLRWTMLRLGHTRTILLYEFCGRRIRTSKMLGSNAFQGPSRRAEDV